MLTLMGMVLMYIREILNNFGEFWGTFFWGTSEILGDFPKVPLGTPLHW